MGERIPAEAFPPGDFIREELEERGWTQGDLAEILGRDARAVNEVINAKRAITPDMAKRLARAFGTSAELWMNLESAHQLSKVRDDTPDLVSRMAALYNRVPLKEMIRRNWIADSDNIEVLEKQVCAFLRIKSVDKEPVFGAAARKSTSYGEATSAQKAWRWRAYHLAKALHAEQFRAKVFKDGLGRLRLLAGNPEDVRQVPRVLAESGVRFLVVQHLPGTKIDGVCFWLNPSSPVVAVSLRLNRIDSFWYTLAHELGHVAQRDRQSSIDCALEERSEERAEEERRADRFAATLLISEEELEDFIRRVRPLYCRQKIEGFARRIGVHPGIVVGQLQHRDEIPYKNLRKTLVPVRELLIQSTLTDGWGCTPPKLI